MSDSQLVSRRTGKCGIGQRKTSNRRIKTKLTDLNEDCLTKIFKYLNCNDIVKMFAVDTCLIDSACRAFKYVCTYSPLNFHFSPLDNDYMDPHDILFAVQNVGSLIRHAKIIGKVTDNILDRRDDEVIQNITYYCLAVADLKLKCIDTDIGLEYFQRFQQLNKLKIHFCSFGGQSTQLQNVTHFHGTIVPRKDQFQRGCGSRNHYVQRITPAMTEHDLLAFFNVNPQLRCVKLFVKFNCESQCYSDVITIDFLQRMDERLRALEKLKLDLGSYNNSYTIRQNGSTCFTNLRKLIVSGRGSFEVMMNYLAPISYVQLEELNFSASFASGTSLTSIQKCQSLRKLTLYFYQFHCTASDIIDLLSSCQHLQYLYIKCNQNMAPKLVCRDFYKSICHFLRNRTNIKIILSLAAQPDMVIDDETINFYNIFN